ncbi:hydantoinase B/oxoprolinase family protein [Bradyrhizobium sp. DASA03076]|uniref:hydantoinase B/oxoprolinase family protein n=1 Tax=Bradyrhizobium sp. BLXBL-03 TaxID=3395916 RepID=UPI003F706DDF
MSTINRITSSIIQQRLEAVVAEMGEAMLRTAYSQILNSSRDFSTAVFDGLGRLVAQADHIPLHVGALPFAVKSVLSAFEGDIWPGDVFLLNDPYFGGNHLPDVTAFVPVFAEGHDRPMFWTINRAHQSDIGGATHGSYNPSATEIWQEGIRIPPIRLYEKGKLRFDLQRMIATNIRHPADFIGDLNAMVGSVRSGERRLQKLLREYGTDIVGAALDDILNGSEAQARACVEAWKDGVFEGKSFLDDDGHDAQSIRLHAKVKKQGSNLHVDLSGCHPQVTGFVNSSSANTVSAVHMALAFLIDPGIPKNEGTFRLVEIKTVEGTIVHPLPPAPVTLSTNHPSQEIAEAIIKALADSCPDRVIAGWGRRFRIAIKGINPRTGKQFIWHLFHARPGAGASSQADGWSNVGELSSAGGLKFGSIEVAEARFPLHFEVHEYRPGSGGAGKHRGGLGSILSLVCETEQAAVGNTAGDGVITGGYGLFGGVDGLPHRYRLSSGNQVRDLKTKETSIVIQPGDRLFVESAGGGGFGPTAERSAEATKADQRDELLVAFAS